MNRCNPGTGRIVEHMAAYVRALSVKARSSYVTGNISCISFETVFFI
jgi:hypothetical protein